MSQSRNNRGGVKEQRIFWMNNQDYKKLKKRVEEYYTGRGSLERFLELIIDKHIVFIDSGIKKDIEITVKD